MQEWLAKDQNRQAAILEKVYQDAVNYLNNRSNQKVMPDFSAPPLEALPQDGLGAEAARNIFRDKYLPWLPASSGPRFFGYVIGGVTPAALAGDWYTSLFDQNAFGHSGSVDRHIELEAIQFICSLLNLPDTFHGVFVSGATTSAMTALACARQWAADQSGCSASEEGLYGLARPEVASGLAHGANYKALTMVGMGRHITSLPLLPEREAVDISALENFLANRDAGRPLIYIANMGTAASGDHDDLNAIAQLKKKYNFWLHVDGAFGGMMACSPKYAHLFAGLQAADSITMDTHKWLNVPYDGAVMLCKHPDYQYQCFTNAASALGPAPREASLYSLTPEGSRRLRALPAWFTLLAYGKKGYAEICERHIALCQHYGQKVSDSPYLRLLNQVRSNVVAFTINLPDEKITAADIQEILDQVQAQGITYSNIAYYLGKPALRICLANWQTELADIDAAFESMESCSKPVFERCAKR